MAAEAENAAFIESEPTNGFLHVKFNDEVGWVWSKSVKVQAPPSTGGDNSRSGVASGGGSSTVGGTSNGGAPENSISADWEKPTPQTSSFESDEGTCQATGDGGDSGTNQRKNRTDVPASYHPVTWNAINTLNYAKGAPKSRMEWTPSELATITPVEGAAVTVEVSLQS